MTNNKSAISQMVEWLETRGNQDELRKLAANWPDKDFDKKWANLVLSLMEGITDKARSLLAAEQSAKGPTEAGLSDDLRAMLVSANDDCVTKTDVMIGIQNRINRYPTTENKGGEVIDEAIRVIRGRINELESLPVTKEQQDFATALGVALSALNDYRPASPTKADKVEPLAELAASKGKWVQIIKQKNNWWMDVFPISQADENELESTPDYTVGLPDYVEAEAKARAFLTGLDDVNGKGGRV